MPVRDELSREIQNTQLRDPTDHPSAGVKQPRGWEEGARGRTGVEDGHRIPWVETSCWEEGGAGTESVFRYVVSLCSHWVPAPPAPLHASVTSSVKWGQGLGLVRI